MLRWLILCIAINLVSQKQLAVKQNGLKFNWDSGMLVIPTRVIFDPVGFKVIFFIGGGGHLVHLSQNVGTYLGTFDLIVFNIILRSFVGFLKIAIHTKSSAAKLP